MLYKIKQRITANIFGTQQETKANLQEEHGLNLKHLHSNSSVADVNSEYTPTLKQLIKKILLLYGWLCECMR